MENKKHTITKTVLCLLMGCALSACGATDRLANIGKPPDMAKISNPQTQPGYQPVSLPMPAPQIATRQPNSMWQSNRKSFFKDQRAGNVGDILTVMINIEDEAELKNNTSRTRNASESAGLDNLLGYETKLPKIFNKNLDNTALVGGGADSAFEGDGKIKREEDVTLKLAAIVTQILPNGNMVISGKQEVRVNFEKRVLNMDGVIRPEDITVDNTIGYEKIAEARISYGGEGQQTDVQQPRYGQQVFDVVFPF